MIHSLYFCFCLHYILKRRYNQALRRFTVQKLFYPQIIPCSFGQNNLIGGISLFTDNFLKEVKNLNKGLGMIITGTAIGLAVGAAATVVSSTRKNRMRMMKKDASKIVRAVSGMVDDISGMMRL